HFPWDMLDQGSRIVAHAFRQPTRIRPEPAAAHTHRSTTSSSATAEPSAGWHVRQDRKGRYRLACSRSAAAWSLTLRMEELWTGTVALSRWCRQVETLTAC